MASKIQSTPFGLTDLFRIKNFGKNPDDLSDSVLTVVDGFPFFAADRIDYEATGAADVSLDVREQIITVPDGEVWMVTNICGTMSEANQAYPLDFSMTLQLNNVRNISTPFPLISKTIESFDSKSLESVTYQPATPILLTPDCQIQLRSYGGAGVGSAAINLYVQFYRLLV